MPDESPQRSPTSRTGSNDHAPDSETLSATVSAAFRLFLERYEPLRPQLYRFCRHLTGDPWDAEDLVQDALARAFAGLATQGEPPRAARAWLFRVASNLWIDETRRRAVRGLYEEERVRMAVVGGATAAPDARATREAAATLLVQLAPQERVAVVLKDVFDFSLEEIAQLLATTVGAVKAALHRGRGKLAGKDEDGGRIPVPQVVDAFCAAFNQHDLDALTELLLDHVAVEVVGATVLHGKETARGTVLWGMVFGSKHMAAPADGGIGQRLDPACAQGVLPLPARLELAFYRGSVVLLSLYAHHDGEFVRAVTRLQLSSDGARVARLRNYFYTPEVIADVCEELGLCYRTNGIYLPEGRS